MKTVKDFDVQGKRILVRYDFNVPMDNLGGIVDDFRIKQTLPTIKYLLENNAKIILMSHLDNPEARLDAVKDRLEKLLNKPVKKTDDCIGEEVEKQSKDLKKGEILLLENLRSHKEETDNDEEFAENLSKLGDIYINDGFSVSHRAHASVVLVPKFLPGGAGLLLEKEIENLDKVLKNPARPLVVLIGGVKAETKAGFVGKMSELADTVLISGLMKKELVKKYSNILKNIRILGPKKNLDAGDIGEETIKTFRGKILGAKTVVWNGPFGKFEDEQYKKGTLAIANAIIESGAFSIAGGGETVQFLNQEGLAEKFSHVSTGGGAMLAYLSGEELPGLKALENN